MAREPAVPRYRLVAAAWCAPPQRLARRRAPSTPIASLATIAHRGRARRSSPTARRAAPPINVRPGTLAWKACAAAALAGSPASPVWPARREAPMAPAPSLPLARPVARERFAAPPAIAAPATKAHRAHPPTYRARLERSTARREPRCATRPETIRRASPAVRRPRAIHPRNKRPQPRCATATAIAPTSTR